MTQSECLPGPSVLCFNGAQIQMLTFTRAPGVCRLGPHLDSDQKTSFFFSGYCGYMPGATGWLQTFLRACLSSCQDSDSF